MTNTLLRGFCTLIISGALAYAMYTRYDKEFRDTDLDKKTLYAPMIHPMMLPIFIIVLIGMSLIFSGMGMTMKLLFGMFIGIFLHISAYYILLMLLLPLFRKFISARACSILWILPNFLYFAEYSFMARSKPLFVIKTIGDYAMIALIVWLAGFVFFMLRSIISHVKFRRSILKSAEEVDDREILNIWWRIQGESGDKKADYRVMRSDKVSTPLSIGLFRRSIRIVLPNREYTREELDLIFRHELIHILHGDNWMKVFLMLCTAICWFNPFIWLSKRRCAEDTELACDELVLLEADETERRQYAELILSSAGDERGFTTCLSATAKSLRYRLAGIIKPRKRLVGGITAGVVLFALIMTSGTLAFAYEKTTVSDVVFNGEPEKCTVSSSAFDISSYDGYHYCKCNDEKALIDYLAGIELYTLSGAYNFDEEGKEIVIIFDKPHVGLCVRDNYVSVTNFGDKIKQVSYYTFSEIDWEYLYSLTDFYDE